MKRFSTLLLIASLFLFACSNSDSESAPGTADSAQSGAPANADGSIQAPSTDMSGAMTTSPAPSAAPVQSQPQVVTTTAEGMNPPHGEPGHRCDIPVGAPLSSPPSSPASSPSAPSSPAVVTSPNFSAPAAPAQAPVAPAGAPSAPSSATAPGMNPPHGEPGHRCDIAVGAPLPK